MVGSNRLLIDADPSQQLPRHRISNDRKRLCMSVEASIAQGENELGEKGSSSDGDGTRGIPLKIPLSFSVNPQLQPQFVAPATQKSTATVLQVT